MGRSYLCGQHGRANPRTSRSPLQVHAGQRVELFQLAHPCQTSRWYDAEAATSTVEHAIGLGSSAVIRHIRGVPETCPACGSHRLSPQRGMNSEHPDIEWERPTCEKCGWVGDPVPIFATADSYEPEEEVRPPPDCECVIPTVPLRTLKKPSDRLPSHPPHKGQ